MWVVGVLDQIKIRLTQSLVELELGLSLAILLKANGTGHICNKAVCGR